jgi:hypothetical protein
VLVIDKVLDGTAPGSSVPHQSTDEPQASRVAPLPDQKAEVRAPCPHRTRLEQLARCGEGDRILRIVEYANVEPDAGRNLGGIGP